MEPNRLKIVTILNRAIFRGQGGVGSIYSLVGIPKCGIPYRGVANGYHGQAKGFFSVFYFRIENILEEAVFHKEILGTGDIKGVFGAIMEPHPAKLRNTSGVDYDTSDKSTYIRRISRGLLCINNQLSPISKRNSVFAPA
jgi:hypothetical protein